MRTMGRTRPRLTPPIISCHPDVGRVPLLLEVLLAEVTEATIPRVELDNCSVVISVLVAFWSNIADVMFILE